MSPSIATEYAVLAQLSEYVTVTMGLHFPEDNWRDFEKRMLGFARELGFGELKSCLNRMKSASLSTDEKKLLASYLTVGETYFFRDLGNFRLLQQAALPERIQERQKQEKKLKIWSAACSSGEEIYSIAMVIDQLLPRRREWEATLLGTDINEEFLDKAKTGVYREWSFRNIDSLNKKKYFQKYSEEEYQISSELRGMVKFCYSNLVEDAKTTRDPTENGWDIIFCCNVLIYFSHAQIIKVVDRLANSLVEGGWLFVSAVEVPFIQHDLLKPIYTKEAMAFKKLSRAAAKPLSTSSSVVEEPTFRATLLQTIEGDSNREQALCQAYYENGQYDQVIEVLEPILIQIKEDSSALSLSINEVTLLIRAFANQKKLQEALQWCEIALEIDKLSPALYYLQAVVCQELGLVDDAIRSLKRALFLDGNFVIAHFLLGHLLLNKKNSKEAERSFRNASSLLAEYPKEINLPWSDGIKAGSLGEIIATLLKQF